MANPNFMKAIKEKFKVFQGLDYKYYEKDFNTVKDIGKNKPKKTGVYHSFSLDEKQRQDKFAFIFEGYVIVPKTEKYKVYLGSDDGSRLFLDDKEIINHDGSHSFEEKSTEVILEKGTHKFKLEYFQKGSSMGLDVEIEYPGFEKTTIPRRWLYRKAK